MKRFSISNISKTGFLLVSIALISSSCVKSVSGRTDFDDLKPTVLLPAGGISQFSAGALILNPLDDTATYDFIANYAATSVAPTDLVVTIKIDQDALAAYNALGGNQYEPFPDSIFNFTTTSITIPKGNNYSDQIPLLLFPKKVNSLKNYMLPISISVAPAGSTISSNFKTIYYHLIGNPIAGVYSRLWVRYNNAAGTGAPAGGSPTTELSPFAPVDGTTVQAVSGSAGLTYVLSFTQTGSVLSDFQVSFDPTSVTGSGVTITGGPTIITADPVTGTYKFNYTYDNGAGGLRNITDTYTKP